WRRGDRHRYSSLPPLQDVRSLLRSNPEHPDHAEAYLAESYRLQSAPNFTSLTPITDAADRSIDFGFGGTASQLDATIGTGPWKTVSWSRNQATQVVVSPTYWGKGRADASVLAGTTTYNFYPDHLRSNCFCICP